MSIGVAVIGAGLVANAHIDALQEIASVKICGVWSRTEANAVAFAERYGIFRYQSYTDVLADQAVNVVINCLPPGNHAEFSIAAAAAKKHVIVEKPIDISVERSLQLIDACRQHGVTLSVIFQNRYTAAACQVKQAIEDGRLGKLILGDAYVKWYRSPDYYKLNAWRGTQDIEGGGALINQAIHSIDLLQWLMGGVKSVAGMVRTTTHSIETEDLGIGMLEFHNGALGVIEASTAVVPSFKERVELHGQKGSIIIEGGNIREWKVEGMNESDYVRAEKVSYGVTNSPAISHINHKAQFEEIFAAIEQGREPLVTGEEGLKALQIVLAIYLSAKTGERVSLN